MKNYYVFRHALATHSVSGYGKDIVSAHILPEGIPPIEKLAQYIKSNNIESDYNVSSEFTRCQETTQIITNITGKIFTTDSRLNEYSAEENYSNESFTVFRDRILSFLMDVEQDDTKKTICICTHGAVIAGIKNILLNGRFSEDLLHDFPPTGVLLATSQNGTLEEHNFNT